MFGKPTSMPTAEQALPGRAEPVQFNPVHAVLGTSMVPPFPDDSERIVFGMGCFWGAERRFWQLDGVYTTSAGYAGGMTPNPTYEEVCTGRTGHTEAVMVVYHRDLISYDDLLRVFWETHDPTQGYRQGNDIGTQYRSAIYTFDETQAAAARASKEAQEASGRFGAPIVTEITPASEFWMAEDYHQQYFEKQRGGARRWF